MSAKSDPTPANGIRYVTGDATPPAGDGPVVIAHVCNDLGRWGKGFVVPLGRRYPTAKARFLAWGAGKGAAEDPRFALGRVQFVAVAPGRWVANLVGQHGLKAKAGVPAGAVRRDPGGDGRRGRGSPASAGAAVHVPRIGCGLAGGTWDRVEPILAETLVAAGVPVVVYDLPADGGGQNDGR